MSRTPEFLLKVMDKVTDVKSGKLGCAWQNEDGSLTIQLDPGVALSATTTQVIKLFPNDRGVPASSMLPKPRAPRKEPEVSTPGVALFPPPPPGKVGKGGTIKMADLPVSVRHTIMDGKDKEE